MNVLSTFEVQIKFLELRVAKVSKLLDFEHHFSIVVDPGVRGFLYERMYKVSRKLVKTQDDQNFILGGIVFVGEWQFVSFFAGCTIWGAHSEPVCLRCATASALKRELLSATVIFC